MESANIVKQRNPRTGTIAVVDKDDATIFSKKETLMQKQFELYRIRVLSYFFKSEDGQIIRVTYAGKQGFIIGDKFFITITNN